MSLWKEAQIKSLIQRTLDMASPDEAEVIFSGGHCSVSRFANCRFHQNVRENRYQLYIRLVKGLKTSAVTIDDFGDESLRRAIAMARDVLAIAADEPELLPLLGPQQYEASPGRYDEKTGQPDMNEIMDGFSDFFGRCEADGFTAAGMLEKVEGTIGDYGELSPLAMGNSKKLFAYSPATSFDFSTTVYRGNASGWGGNAGPSFAGLQIEKVRDRALAKAKAALDPKPLAPGKYRVVLEPAAVHELMAYLAAGFNAQAVEDGSSFLAGKLGKQIFPDWFSLTDDAYHPMLGGAPFDGEGVPVKRLPLVEKGVVKNFATTRALAQKLKMAATGHGTFLPNPAGALPHNVVMSGGTKSTDELIAETDRGILVTRFWYLTPVVEKKLIISGMTRDGTYLVENGKIKHAVTNLRFNECIPEMLARVITAGKPELCFGTITPALSVEAFPFTSGTEF